MAVVIKGTSGDDGLHDQWPGRVTSNHENLYGLDGNDFIAGYLGNDLLDGGPGNDLLVGNEGRDTFDGGTGADTVAYAWEGGRFSPIKLTLNGSNDATVLVNGVAEDTIRNVENIWGGSVNDVLTGDGVANWLVGMDGNDCLKGMSGSDQLDGWGGIDTADYSDKTTSVAVTLNTNQWASVSVGGVGEDVIVNIENVWGGSGSDRLTGDTLANGLRGNGGKDVLNGGSGNDKLTGGSAGDLFVFEGAFGIDTIMDWQDRADTPENPDRLDRIDLRSLSGVNDVNALNDLLLVQKADGSVWITLDLNHNGVTDSRDLDGNGTFDTARIIVQNATVSDFGAADFLF